MTALLILGGVTLAVLGWLWLWLRLAGVHWSWGLAGIVPPLALVGGLLNVRRTLLPVLALLAGLAVLLGGLWQLWQNQPQQLERLLRGQWSTPGETLMAGEPVEGRLQGQFFLPDRFLLTRGVLILRQGQGLIANKEVRLDLSSSGTALLDDQFALDVLPTDRNQMAGLELLWQDMQTGQPQARRLQQGFTLSVHWQRQEHGLEGQLYLSVPTQQPTLLSGSFLVLAADEIVDPAWSMEAPADIQQLNTEETVAEPLVPEPELTLDMLLASPGDWLRRTLYVETRSGRQIQGEFQGVNEEGALLIRQLVRAPGFVDYQVFPAEVVLIQLRRD